MISQRDVDRAITEFIETRERKPLVALIRPAVAQRPAGKHFMTYRGVLFYSDDRVAVMDKDGRTILFMLGDCIYPAINIYPDNREP